MTTTSTSPPSSTSTTSSRTARGEREHAAASPAPSRRGLHLRRDGYTALDYKTQAVDSGELLRTTMPQIDGEKGRYALCHSTKAIIPHLRVHMQCWLWVVLLTVLLPTSAAYSAKRIPRLEEGNCRYDLTSISALSCMQADGRVRRPPSHTCCKALVYAIDRVPVGNVSGACCLCRYMKERTRVSGLATAYILCNGKDKHIVAKWSLFPIKNCSKVCTEGNIFSSVDMGTYMNEDIPDVDIHGAGSGKGILIAVGVLIVMGLICFWNFRRRFKAAASASAHHWKEPKAERRRSVAASSSRKPKERRFSPS